MENIKGIKTLFGNLDEFEGQSLLKELDIESVEKITLKRLHSLVRSKTTNFNAKDSACSLLRFIGNKKSIGLFIELFNDDELFPQAMWALSTSSMRNDKALEFLIKTLKSSLDEEKVSGAAYCLRNYTQNEKAEKSLVEVLNDKTLSNKVRGQAAESLGCIGDNRHTKVLVQNLKDESIDVQFWCIYALWQVCMDTSAIPELEKFIGNKTIIGNMFIVEEEAKAAIRFIKARGKVLQRLGITDRSKDAYWKIHEEVRLEVEKIEKETGEFYKDMTYFKENKLVP